MKKKLIKAGIASAMICTVLGSTVVPTSAKEVPVDTAKEVTKIAEEVTPRFMYTQTRTVTSWGFDTVVTIDTVETSRDMKLVLGITLIHTMIIIKALILN